MLFCLTSNLACRFSGFKSSGLIFLRIFKKPGPKNVTQIRDFKWKVNYLKKVATQKEIEIFNVTVIENDKNGFTLFYESCPLTASTLGLVSSCCSFVFDQLGLYSFQIQILWPSISENILKNFNQIRDFKWNGLF